MTDVDRMSALGRWIYWVSWFVGGPMIVHVVIHPSIQIDDKCDQRSEQQKANWHKHHLGLIAAAVLNTRGSSWSRDRRKLDPEYGRSSHSISGRQSVPARLERQRSE